MRRQRGEPGLRTYWGMGARLPGALGQPSVIAGLTACGAPAVGKHYTGDDADAEK
jgi:hypothetical protein